MPKAVARTARPRRVRKVGPPAQMGLRSRVQADADRLKPPPPGRALARRLVKEVERLEAELAAARAEAVALATTAERDPLTGVLNRRGFERELERSLAYVRRYGANAALVYLDLDAFKPVNDRHGHAAGDTVLKTAAAALVGNVRASDLVARIGDDEFVVLL